MTRILYPITVSFVFLVINVIILRVILALNRRPSVRPRKIATPDQRPGPEGPLDPSNILEWEFEYARTTASEAMQHRFTTINFYLLALGIITSGVFAVLGQGSAFPKAVGTALLWLLCGIGCLYFLELIRLRQAWHDSARTMQQIKDFYIQHATGFEPEVLRSAFRWKTETLPPPDKPWTAFFYSAILIGLLNSVAYVAGAALLALDAIGSFPLSVLGPLVLFGLAFFALYVWLYFAFLRP
jgi:hypothetical protein